MNDKDITVERQTAEYTCFGLDNRFNTFPKPLRIEITAMRNGNLHHRALMLETAYKMIPNFYR